MWNIPNSLTAVRIVLIPVFVGFAYIPGRWGLILAAGFFSLAALTDWADGYLARTRGEMTPFGRFFDPVADKLLVISALLLLIAMDRVPLFFVLLIIAREIIVMALREFMAGLGQNLLVSTAGKWKTGFQMTAIIMLLLQDGLWNIPFQWPGLICFYVSVVLTLWSGYTYVTTAWPGIRSVLEESSPST